MITNLKRIEGHEAALRNDYDQLVAAVVQEFPSLRNGPPDPAMSSNFAQDPSSFQKLAQWPIRCCESVSNGSRL